MTTPRGSRDRLSWLGLLAIAGGLLLPGTAQADLLTLRVTGTVTAIYDDPGRFELDSSVAVGSPYELIYVVDTAVPDLLPSDPVEGRYLVMASSGHLGNYAWASTTVPNYEARIANNFPFLNPEDPTELSDLYSLIQPDLDITGTAILHGVPTLITRDWLEIGRAQILLQDANALAITADSFAVPVLEDWPCRSVEMYLTDQLPSGNAQFIVLRGTVDNIAQVPEPGTALITMIAIVSLAARRRPGTGSRFPL